MLDTVELSSPGAWQWGNKKGQVSMDVVAHKPSSISDALGPSTFGTPIIPEGKRVSQTIYVKWPGQGWVEVSMQVPQKHEAWLSTIAQSIHIG